MHLAAPQCVGITFYGSEQHEAALLQEIAARRDVTPTITSVAASEATAGLSAGNRCISIGHKSQISKPLFVLSTGPA